MTDPPERPHRVTYGPDARQLVDVVLAAPGPANALVLLVHGGFWRAERSAAELLPLAAELAGGRVAAGVVEYRATDLGARWPDPLDDVLCGLAAAASGLGVPLGRVVLAGHSAGGQLALLAAQRLEGLGSVVALSPITDLVAAAHQEWAAPAVAGLLPTGDPQALREASPAYVWSRPIRTVVLHAGSDQTVPVEQSESFAARVRALDPEADLRVELLEGARHMHLVKKERPAWRRVRTVLLDLATELAGRELEEVDAG